MEKAGQLYRQALRDHPVAIDYLKQRGLDGETAGKFGIGYAPSGWDTLLSALGHEEEDRQQLLSAGLVVSRDTGGFYDRFRDRIMFPIRDARGRTLGFGGRILASGEPKYLNSPETALFHKGRELYGLFEARREDRKLERLLVVEGYMDVIMLAAHGIRNAVATLGTTTTSEHLRRIFGVVSEVIFVLTGTGPAGKRPGGHCRSVCRPCRTGARFAFFSSRTERTRIPSCVERGLPVQRPPGRQHPLVPIPAGLPQRRSESPGSGR